MEPQQNEKRYVHIQNASIPPYLSLNYKGPAYSDKEIDIPTLKVISSILFSKRSELYRKLIVKENKVRYIYGNIPTSRDPDLIEINVSLVKREDFPYVLNEIENAIDKLKTTPLEDNLIKDAISNVKYSFAMRLDTPGSVAHSLAHYISLTGDPESLNKHFSLYDNITKENIIKIANKYFVDKTLTVATISSEESEKLN